MRKFYVLFCILMIGLAIAGSILVSEKSPRGDGTHLGENDLEKDTRVSSKEMGSESQDVRALTLKLAQKDVVIASLLAKNMTDSKNEPNSDSKTPEEDRVTAIKRVLDERVERRLSNSFEAEQLQSDIQEVIDRGVLGNTTMTTLNCADNLCKLSLKNENGEELESSVITLSRSMGKASGALTVFNGDAAEKHVYIAKSSEALAVSLPDDPKESEPVIIRKEDDTPGPSRR